MPDEEEGGESELRLDRQELKKFMKMASKKELTFAFCPTSGKEEPMFTIHRRKKPDALGKMAKKEAEETKFACGKMTVEGKVLTLQCDRVVAGLEKKLTKVLRKMKVPMKVQISGGGNGGGAA